MDGGIMYGCHVRGADIRSGSGSLKRQRLRNRGGIRIARAVARRTGRMRPEVKYATHDGGKQQSYAGGDQYPIVAAWRASVLRARFARGIEACAERIHRHGMTAT